MVNPDLPTAELPVLFRAGELAGLIGGACKGFLDAPIRSVVADSRAARLDSMFVALKGEHTDGHLYIKQAIENGARVVMAEFSRRDMALDAIHASNMGEKICLILVDSTMKGIQQAACEYRRRNSLLRIGVTGSSGKTTTKECIAAILSACYPPESVAMSPGNLNSDIGLALALFDLRPQHTIGVFEMGINRKGEMDELASMYEPDIAVITNIGTAHIGMFGSRDEIAKEKGKIFSHFDGHQKALLWEDDQYRQFLASLVRGTVHYYGLKSTEGIEEIENLGLKGWRIGWKQQTIEFGFPGQHNLLNACAALSIANMLELDPAQASRGLSSVKPLFGRSEIREGRITVLQDCYNANPDSIAAAIEFFSALPSDNRKILVLGSMLELGEESERAHENVGLMAGNSGAEAIFLFGQEMAAAEAALKGRSFKGMLMLTDSMNELIEAVSGFVQPGDLLLVKGSRGMALEMLTKVLEEKGFLSPSGEASGGTHAS